MNQKSNPKVLLVPAWYPASFFAEQMRLVEDAFDFKVLIGTRNEFGKRKALKYILRLRFRIFDWNECKPIGNEEDIVNVQYSYINSLSKYYENKQYVYLNKCFKKKLDELSQSGWTPDLVHIQSLSDTAVFVCNWAKENNIPVILTEHVIYIRRRFDFFQKEKEKVYSLVDKVLCVSSYVYQNLLVHGFTLNDVSIIGNLVDDRFIPSFESVKESSNSILFVATHLHDKDIEVLLQTVNLLIKSGFTNFKLDILGINPDQFYQNGTNSEYLLKDEIDKMGLSAYIHLKGLLAREDILKSYKEYSVLVSTSFSETFGLCVAEALANGVPVVCTDSGGIRDFVNETNGIILPIRNPKALATAIVRMFNNISNYNGEQISTEIRKFFGLKAFTERITSEYRNAKYDK